MIGAFFTIYFRLAVAVTRIRAELSGRLCRPRFPVLSLLCLPLFIARMISMRILRYGGLRASVPFFLGVILDECVPGRFWTIIGIIRGIPACTFWP